MTDPLRRPVETELTWATLGSQLRFYRMLLVTLLALLAVHVTSGGWAQFRPSTPETTVSAETSPATDSDHPASPPSTSPVEKQLTTPKKPSATQAKPPSGQPSKPSKPDAQPASLPAANFPQKLKTSIRMAGYQWGRAMASSFDSGRRSAEDISAAMGDALTAQLGQFLRRREPTKRLPASSPATSPTAVASKPPAVETSGLVLHNPRANGGAVGYLLDGVEHRLQPGQSQRLSRATSPRIEFHRGGNFGHAVLSLSPGVYAFQVTRRGWDLIPILQLPGVQ